MDITSNDISKTTLGAFDTQHIQRAIVLGAEHPRALAVIQALGRANIPVVAIDHNSAPLGFCSRYVSEKFAVANSDGAALALLEQLGESGGGVIIPTNDDYLLLVSKNFHSLSRHFVLTTPPWDILEPMIDIPRFYEAAQKIGVRTPAFLQPKDAQEMISYVQDLDFRNHSYLLKTRPGSVPADSRSGRFSKVAGSDPGEVKENCLEIYNRLGEFPVIVKVIPGEADRCIGVCMVVNKDHEAIVCYCVRRLRLFTYSRGGQFVHPYVLGANVFCESIHDDEAVETAKRLVKRMKYFGAIALEFRRDSRDESLTLIKADPRPVRATSLSAALGQDLPLALYQEFTSRISIVMTSYRDGIAWVWASAYLSSVWGNRHNRPILKELFTLLKGIRNIKAVANLDHRDPIPFLVEQKRWWGEFVSSLSRGVYRKLTRIIQKNSARGHGVMKAERVGTKQGA